MPACHCLTTTGWTAYGRYYDEWSALQNAGDYYPWLARKMGDREPWRTWARLDRDSMIG